MGIRVGMAVYVLLIAIIVFSILTAFAEQPSLGAVAGAAKGAESGDVVLRWSSSSDCTPHTINYRLCC